MDAAGDQADIAKTIENYWSLVFEAWRVILKAWQELWVELLAHWMAAGWLADGLAGGGWEAGWPQGPQELRHQVRGRVIPNFVGPRTTTSIKKPNKHSNSRLGTSN